MGQATGATEATMAATRDVDAAHGGGIFDLIDRPSPELIADCVHCGFCLPTCPTYALWGEEMDSPRGRIYLMEMGLAGEIAMDETFVSHLDACLGCMACVTACPSGVQYDKLIEATRGQIERNYPRSLAERAFRGLIFALFPHPARLRVAAVGAWLYQRLGLARLARRTGVLARLPSRLAALEGLLPAVRLRDLRRAPPALTRARGQRRMRVGLVAGCVQSVFFARVNEATARVLAADGCEVVTPADQGCCGALMVHAGRREGALEAAKSLIATFEGAGVDRVVINAAGCGSTLKEYGQLLADDPAWADRAAAFAEKVCDVSELCDELAPGAQRHPIPARVAYHDACHLSHAQNVRSAPRRMLRGIPGLTLTELSEPEVCCGSAGIYNLLQPEPAAELGARKAASIHRVAPDAVATGNPGCLMQLARELDGGPPLYHPIELIDAAIRGVDLLDTGAAAPANARATKEAA
jgi:glycolate oxidase iron-sulfur subunit